VTRSRRAYRDADGQRVEGTWRHIFVRNADVYYLADLVVYADGAIDTGTGGLTDHRGLAQLLRSGRVATILTDGAWTSAAGPIRVSPTPTGPCPPTTPAGTIASRRHPTRTTPPSSPNRRPADRAGRRPASRS
jgi:hypothetical protein